MPRWLIFVLLAVLALPALAEGGCPPGQYPIGGQGVQGCAPIPGAGGSQSSGSPRPTGKWETRWGAIAEDTSNMSTGTAVSYKSKRAAVSAALDDCKRVGGKSCKLRIAYYNQCVAMADPTVEFRQRSPQGSIGQTMASAAETLELAKANAMKRCEDFGSGQECSVVYSACSMSEFKAF